MPDRKTFQPRGEPLPLADVLAGFLEAAGEASFAANAALEAASKNAGRRGVSARIPALNVSLACLPAGGRERGDGEWPAQVWIDPENLSIAPAQAVCRIDFEITLDETGPRLAPSAKPVRG